LPVYYNLFIIKIKKASVHTQTQTPKITVHLQHNRLLYRNEQLPVDEFTYIFRLLLRVWATAFTVDLLLRRQVAIS